MITGTNGFIGQRLLEYTKKFDFDVCGVDATYFDAKNWKTELVSCLNTLDPSFIFHVGACSDTLENDIQFMMTRNYESTKVITDWCCENDRRIIYSSSAANYGESGLYPSNLYGWSKYVAEDYVVKSGGIALRYFNVYGPGEQNKGRMASFLYQAFLKHQANEKIFIFPGNPRRDFVYIEDVLTANFYAHSKYEELKGNFYEVSTGRAHTFEEKLQMFGFEYFYTDKDKIPTGYQFYTCGNPHKWMPGWKPKFYLEEGVLDYKQKLENEYSN